MTPQTSNPHNTTPTRRTIAGSLDWSSMAAMSISIGTPKLSAWDRPKNPPAQLGNVHEEKPSLVRKTLAIFCEKCCEKWIEVVLFGCSV